MLAMGLNKSKCLARLKYGMGLNQCQGGRFVSPYSGASWAFTKQQEALRARDDGYQRTKILPARLWTMVCV